MKPICDLCMDLAIYDAKTKAGPWAYLCQRHYDNFGASSSPELRTILSDLRQTKDKKVTQ